MMPEFVVALSIVIFVCGTAFYISTEKNTDIEFIKTKESALNLCNLISSSIDEVQSMDNGASISIYVPSKINFADYSAQVTSQKSVIISFSFNSVICPFTADVTNNTSHDFPIQNGNMNFLNKNNEVVVSFA